MASIWLFPPFPCCELILSITLIKTLKHRYATSHHVFGLGLEMSQTSRKSCASNLICASTDPAKLYVLSRSLST